MKTIYIEGTSESDNGSLREAFSKLFEQELKGKMPHIIMGDGKNQTIDKFHSAPLHRDEHRFLLFDSDMPTPDKARICKDFNEAKPNRKVDASTANTFLMIQEVEAWLLSQPEILEQAGVNMKKFKTQDVESITKPSEKLSELYRNSKKSYTKVREFVKVFSKLDSTKLRQSCPEYDALIEALAK